MNLSKEQKIRMPFKEISAQIKQRLKKEFPDCTFSVQAETYSGGRTMTISLLSSKTQIKKTYEQIEPHQKQAYLDRYNEKQLRELQERTHNDLNQYTLLEKYDSTKWCNGIFLTPEGHEILRKIAKISNEYNYDNSDLQSDYIDVNFFLNIQLGKHNKPFQEI